LCSNNNLFSRLSYNDTMEVIRQIQLENLKDENDGFKLRYRMNQL